MLVNPSGGRASNSARSLRASRAIAKNGVSGITRTASLWACCKIITSVLPAVCCRACAMPSSGAVLPAARCTSERQRPKRSWFDAVEHE